MLQALLVLAIGTVSNVIVLLAAMAALRRVFDQVDRIERRLDRGFPPPIAADSRDHAQFVGGR